MHHPTYRIAHTTAFVTPVVEHWLEHEIAQWVHYEGFVLWKKIFYYIPFFLFFYEHICVLKVNIRDIASLRNKKGGFPIKIFPSGLHMC